MVAGGSDVEDRGGNIDKKFSRVYKFLVRYHFSPSLYNSLAHVNCYSGRAMADLHP